MKLYISYSLTLQCCVSWGFWALQFLARIWSLKLQSYFTVLCFLRFLGAPVPSQSMKLEVTVSLWQTWQRHTVYLLRCKPSLASLLHTEWWKAGRGLGKAKPRLLAVRVLCCSISDGPSLSSSLVLLIPPLPTTWSSITSLIRSPTTMTSPLSAPVGLGLRLLSRTAATRKYTPSWSCCTPGKGSQMLRGLCVCVRVCMTCLPCCVKICSVTYTFPCRWLCMFS